MEIFHVDTHKDLFQDVPVLNILMDQFFFLKSPTEITICHIIANATEILQSCTELSIYSLLFCSFLLQLADCICNNHNIYFGGLGQWNHNDYHDADVEHSKTAGNHWKVKFKWQYVQFCKVISHQIGKRLQRHVSINNDSTHWSRVMHIYDNKLGHHWFKQWRVACMTPSYDLNKYWYIFIELLGMNCSEIVIKIQQFLL